uniref:(northern house mosquito) hypothetical protein n=1 Tax=Culex pipiens TaxID=7175 RepID=A0A8D8K6F1_CULPI
MGRNRARRFRAVFRPHLDAHRAVAVRAAGPPPHGGHRGGGFLRERTEQSAGRRRRFDGPVHVGARPADRGLSGPGAGRRVPRDVHRDGGQDRRRVDSGQGARGPRVGHRLFLDGVQFRLADEQDG